MPSASSYALHFNISSFCIQTMAADLCCDTRGFLLPDSPALLFVFSQFSFWSEMTRGVWKNP